MSDRLLLRGLLIVLAVVGLTWLAAGLVGDSAYLANEEANDRYATGDTRAALTRYRALQRERPELREIDVNAGNAALRLREFPRALLDHASATRSADSAVRSAAFYDRGNALFELGRYPDARASWVDSLRADPTQRDAKFNLEVVDALLAALAQLGPAGNQAGQGQPAPGGQGPGQQPQPGQSQPPGPAQPGQQPSADQGQGARGDPRAGASPPPSVSQAVIQFRRNLSTDEAFRVLDALRNEQQGLQGLLEGLPARRGPQGPPLY